MDGFLQAFHHCAEQHGIRLFGMCVCASPCVRPFLIKEEMGGTVAGRSGELVGGWVGGGGAHYIPAVIGADTDHI